jgi:germination protein M
MAAEPPGEQAPLDSVERRRRAVRWVVLAAIVVVAALIAVVLILNGDSSDDPDDDGPASTSTSTSSTTTSTTSTTVPTVTEPPAVFTIGSTDPLETTRRFGSDYLGMATPHVERDSTSGATEVVTLRTRPGHPMVTKVTLERDAAGKYVVAGSKTANIVVDLPKPDDAVGSPVRVSGESTAYEATVRVEVRQNDGRVIGRGIVMGGANGQFGPFSGDITFERSTTRTGAIVFVTDSAEDGSVQEATVVPVVFS